MYYYATLYGAKLAALVGIATVHAQTWNQAATTLLVATSESNLAAGFTNNLPIVIPITFGVAIVMFFLGWLLSRISGRH
jgi:hypothetical protein